MLRPALAIATLVGAGLAACAVRPPAPPPAPTTAGSSITIHFDDMAPGRPPAGFRCASPGPAEARPARWEVTVDPTAPSPGQVLVQADNDDTNYRFPVALLEGRPLRDARVAVRAKAIAGGNRDRSFGVVVRAKDERNYYVARANTAGWGSNVRFYRFLNGERLQLDEWEGEVKPDTWYSLQVEAVGDVFTVSLDGKQVLRVQDATFAEAGLAGVWTKAESVSAFDDLTLTELTK